jgi:hypothetical protein
MAAKHELTSVDLDPGECALILIEDSGSITPRVVASADVVTEGPDLPLQLEFVQALAMRLLKDPDFQDDVMDWYYAHQDEADEEGDEDEE